MAELRLTFSQTDPKNKNILINVSYYNKDELVNESCGQPFHFTIEASKYEDLRWYLEDYLEFPDQDSLNRTQEIEQWLNELGRDIFGSVFFHLDNQQIFDLFKKGDSPHFITLVSDTNDILQLPWEMITNKRSPLAQQNISLRRQIKSSKQVKGKPGHLPVRLLLIVSRPDDITAHCNHHSTQAIIDALLSMDKNRDVFIDYCSSPTLDKITEQLTMAKDINQPYTIVHFDGYSNYDSASNSASLYLEKTDTGNPLKTKSDIIPVEKLGNILNKNSVPLLILETGSSNRTDNTSSISISILKSEIASRLLGSGVANVISISLAFSLRSGTVFFKTFFKELLAKKCISQALNSGRISLLSLTDRKNSLYPGDNTISLNGWFVPQLYQNCMDMPLIRIKKKQAEQPSKETRKQLPQASETGAFPSYSVYDFIGRENEIYTLARIFENSNATLLQSSDGFGKTSFVCRAAEWLTQSGYFSDGACYINFERPVTVEQIARVICCYVEGQSFNILHEQKQTEKARKYFLKKKMMIVFDNFDFIFSAKSEEYKELYDEKEKKSIINFISDWSVLPQCKGRLVIVSRIAQAPLKKIHTFKLKGLERSNSFAHILQVMSRQDIPLNNQYLQKPVLNELLAVLLDNPLFIELVAGNLKTMNPGKILNEIKTISDKFNQSVQNDKDKASKAILYFYTLYLSPDVRDVFKWLELFQGGVFEDIFLKISAIKEEKWKDIRKELQTVSLIKIDHNYSLAGRPYLHFHSILYTIARIISSHSEEEFSGTNLQERGIPLDKLPEIQKRYMGIYYSLNVMLKKALKGVTERIAMDTLSLEELNIKKAINLTIENQGFKVAVWMCDTLTEYLEKTNRIRERDRWISYLNTLGKKQISEDKIAVSKKKKVGKRNSVSDDVKKEENDPVPSEKSKKIESNKKRTTITVKDSEEQIEFAWTLFAEGKINDSIQSLKNLENQLKGDIPFTPDFQRAKANLTLGQIYYKAGKISESIDILTKNSKEWKRIVKRAKELKEDKNDCLFNRTVNLYSLTGVLIAGERYEDALKYAYEAHKIDKELKNEKNIITGYIQIAQILSYLDRYKEAETTNKQALQLVENLGDEQLKGDILQHQAILAESMGNTGKAIKTLLQALDIYTELKNEESMFQAYNLLAEFEERIKKFDKARKWYNESLIIAKNNNDGRSYASIKQKIGMLYQVEGESELKNGNKDAALILFEKAKQSIEESLTIKKELLDEPGQADSLALIAQLNLFTGNLHQAEIYANQARIIDEKIGSEAVSFDYYILSEIEKEKGNNDKATEWKAKLQAFEKRAKH